MKSPHAAVIAVASGKGGTGKTTVAVHLALAASSSSALLIDLDVEAPDTLGYFPRTAKTGESLKVKVSVPQRNKAACNGCGLCAKSCRFGAIYVIGKVVTIDSRICKGCGRCTRACPEKALTETEHQAGTVSTYQSGHLTLLEGRMDVGDIRSTAVIEASKRQAEKTGIALQVRDCPPGTSCPATHAIEGADYVVLVAEPTEFSLHDLGLASQLVHDLQIPSGVVINKYGFGNANIDGFCASHDIPKRSASMWEESHEIGVWPCALKAAGTIPRTGSHTIPAGRKRCR